VDQMIAADCRKVAIAGIDHDIELGIRQLQAVANGIARPCVV
jgi:hypothetical protein